MTVNEAAADRQVGGNPYVGPRPFTSRESLPARTEEVLELRHTLMAMRIVVLHSPSGAGKTSLIKAHNGLRTEMIRRGFLVRPTLRVSQPLPLGLAGTVNRYELSVLRALDDDMSDSIDLARLGLAGWLDANCPGGHGAAEVEAGGRSLPRQRELLLFDQFEEILTTEPTDDVGRDAFFDCLARVLLDPYRWALFIVREDYLGALDPWARRLPTLLSNRFRIDLLGAAAAREAIERPAKAEGVQFSADALQHLVDELLQTSIQQLDGAMTRREGNWVEPVHLQVVCRRLWSQLEDGATRIELAQVRELGDVDAALAGFYDEQMNYLARTTGTPERFIRDWIATRLISVQGVRVPIMLGLHSSDGLPNRVIEALESAHLIRGEERRRIKWYELSHDRLVPAVRQSNLAWAERHLHPMQMQASLWERQGRRNEMLLHEDALPAAEAWAASNDSELTTVENAYLECSRERVAEQLRERMTAERLAREQARRLRLLLIGAVVLSVALLGTIVAGGFAYYMSNLAYERGEKVQLSERLYKRVMFDSVLTSLRVKTEEQLRVFVTRYVRQLTLPEGDASDARTALQFYLLVTAPKEWYERLPITHEPEFLTRQIRRKMADEIGMTVEDEDLRSSHQAAAIFMSIAQDDEFMQSRDLMLTRDVREVLRRGASEAGILARIVSTVEEGGGGAAMNLRELVGPDIFEDRNVSVPRAFTPAGWPLVKEAITASASPLPDDWVLGLTEEELKEIRTRRSAKLMALYRVRYIESWTRMIEGMRMSPPRTHREGVDRLARLVEGSDPPFERVFRSLRHSVDSMNEGLAIFRDSEGVSSFDRAFTDLLDFTIPEAQDGRVIERPVDLLREAHTVLRSVVQDPARRSVAIDELRALIAHTRDMIEHANLGEWRDEAKVFLLQPMMQMLLLLDTTELQDAWCTGLVEPLVGHLEGRYPFVERSDFEASLADFSKYFGPRGEIQRARDELLASWLRREGDRWVAHVGDATASVLDPPVVAFINAAEDVGETFFADRQLRLDLSVSVQCDRWQIHGVELGVGEASYVFGCDEVVNHLVHWPGEGSGTRFLVRGREARKEFAFAGEWGEWGLLRLMEAEGVRSSSRIARLDVVFDMWSSTLGVITLGFAPQKASLSADIFGLLRSPDVFPPRRLFMNGSSCNGLGESR